jgi:FMN phosphatase YigB (HAD superfamily)
MKTLGISIDGVLRDLHGAFDKQYRSAYIHNPSLVEMNKDMTVKENTQEELDTLEKRIALQEKELISLPITTYNLNNHYKFEEETAMDGETILTPEEALKNFMNNRKPFRIYGDVEQYEGAADALNRIQSYGLVNNLYKTVLISNTDSKAIPATFHFLHKVSCRVRNVTFIEEDFEKWDHCDIIIDCVPEVIQNVPKGKTIIKIERPFNQYDKVEHSFKSLRDVNPTFIEDLFVGEKSK